MSSIHVFIRVLSWNALVSGAAEEQPSSMQPSNAQARISASNRSYNFLVHASLLEKNKIFRRAQEYILIRSQSYKKWAKIGYTFIVHYIYRKNNVPDYCYYYALGDDKKM